MNSIDNDVTVNFSTKIKEKMVKPNSTNKIANTLAHLSPQQEERAADTETATMFVTLDENLGQIHVKFLQDSGYIAERVTNDLLGADDDIVWQRVCAEGHFFITLDLDFSDVRRFPPGTHPGILLLRPRNGSRQAVLDILSRVLVEQPLETLRGCLVVADEIQTRFAVYPLIKEEK